jgi:NAD(P)-dependent dehydrogenase (short-subunit alcohol dehydrogenase family)
MNQSSTKNKIALVTGGSRGLGKDMALSLSKKNIDVILTYHSKKAEAEEVVDEIIKNGQKAIALQFDVSNLKSYDNFVNTVMSTLKENWNTDKFDFLINNAGIGATIPIEKVTEEVFDNLMNIHFKGIYFLTQKFLPNINSGGGIVFISSGSTRFNVFGYSVYASLKGAVEVFSKYVAKEYGKNSIRSNVVAPGAIETDFNGAALRNNPERQTMIAGQTALGRTGKADDIGGVVAFLCTDDAKWVNGQRIEVTGGINL